MKNPYLIIYFFAAIGVLVSIILPILRAQLPQPPSGQPLARNKIDIIKPYLITAAFSLISAILIIAGIQPDVGWQEALIAGYAWDSTMQKMRGVN